MELSKCIVIVERIKEYNYGKFLARYTGAGEREIHGI